MNHNPRMKRLFLDDNREPIECSFYMTDRVGEEASEIYLERWAVVKSYPEFVSYITEMGLPDVVSFDHDLVPGHHKNWVNGEINYNSEVFLDDKNKTGFHCAQWMISYCSEHGKKLPQYMVHSMSFDGWRNIEDLLDNYQRISDIIHPRQYRCKKCKQVFNKIKYEGTTSAVNNGKEEPNGWVCLPCNKVPVSVR